MSLADLVELSDEPSNLDEALLDHVHVGALGARPIERRAHRGFITDQHHLRLASELPGRRQRSRDDHSRAVVATHGIDGDAQRSFVVHGAQGNYSVGCSTIRSP